ERDGVAVADAQRRGAAHVHGAGGGGKVGDLHLLADDVEGSAAEVVGAAPAGVAGRRAARTDGEPLLRVDRPAGLVDDAGAGAGVVGARPGDDDAVGVDGAAGNGERAGVGALGGD